MADMIAAGRPKSAIAKFLYISESTLRRFLARVRSARLGRPEGARRPALHIGQILDTRPVL